VNLVVETITSIATYQYAVLTFSANCLNFGSSIIGFYLDSSNYLGIQGNNFDIKTAHTGAVQKVHGLSTNTVYKYVILWSPEYARISVYTPAGVLISDCESRNPPNQAMPLVFKEGAGGSLRISEVTVYRFNPLSPRTPPPFTTEGVEGVKITDGVFTYKHALYSVNLHIEALAGSQDYILIDLSDIVNFPHTLGTGTIYIAGIHVNLNPTTAFRGDLHIGFLENVNGTDGDFHTLIGWHDDQQGAEIDAEIDKVLNPFVCSSVNHLTNDISLDDTAFQTDVALSSPFDSVAAYTTMSGDGDIALRLVRTAGTVDFDVTVQYYVI